MRAYLVVALFLTIATANAALMEWDAAISVNDDGSNDWTVTLTYNTTVTKSDYFILSAVQDLEVKADNVSINCDITEDIGTSVVCKDISASQVVYKFHTKKFVDSLQKLKIFRYPFSVTQPVEKMRISLELPLGTAIVEDLKLGSTGLKPFEPDFGRQGTDGRRIFVTWNFEKPTLGQTINVYTIYEILGVDQFMLFGVIITTIIVVFLIVLYTVSRSHRIADILPVLTESERKVMEIILREKGEVDQRVIVKETDFSKAKVSRVINDLIARGLLEKHSRGRKNLIKLKKEVKRPENNDGLKKTK
jgi:predicted transcriptional regulator